MNASCVDCFVNSNVYGQLRNGPIANIYAYGKDLDT